MGDARGEKSMGSVRACVGGSHHFMYNKHPVAGGDVAVVCVGFFRFGIN